MTATKVLLLMSVILVFNCNVSYSQPQDQNNAAANCPGGSCVVQQICHGGPSPQAFNELVSLVKEMKKKLDVMEAKLDAVCDGECPTKRGMYKMTREYISTL